jgi:hypothetical protein
MVKLSFVVGAGVGFLVGSKIGRGPYEQLEAKARTLRGRSDVQGALGRAKTTVGGQVAGVSRTVRGKLPFSGGGGVEEGAGDTLTTVGMQIP